MLQETVKESRNSIGFQTNKNGGVTPAFCYGLKTQHIGCGPLGDNSFQQSLLTHSAVILTDCLVCLMHNRVSPRRKNAWERHFWNHECLSMPLFFYLQLAWIRISTLRVIFFPGVLKALLHCCLAPGLLWEVRSHLSWVSDILQWCALLCVSFYSLWSTF